MKIKEKIILQSIEEVTNKISKIDHILKATPLIDIIKIERETIENVKKMRSGSSGCKEALSYLNSSIKKRNALRRLAKKQENRIALIEQKAKLSLELCDLNNELYCIVQKRT